MNRHFFTPNNLKAFAITFIIAASLLQFYKASAQACPTTFTLTGGGSECPGTSAPFSFALSGSQFGVSYQLQNGGVNVGAPVAGRADGHALTWNNIFSLGTYTVVGNNGTCNTTMSGQPAISNYPLAQVFTISSTGPYCAGGSGATISLDGSEIGVKYQLKKGTTNVGGQVSGTGSSLTWPGIKPVGTYTINATTSNGCTNTMNGSVDVTTNPLPLNFNVSGGGKYCQGGAGVSVKLSGSETGVNYQLLNNGVNYQSPISGTGSLLTWNNVTPAGAYTVLAINAATGCSKAMGGSANVTITSLPVFSVTGGVACSPSSVTVGLSGSQGPESYQLVLNGVNIGTPIIGNGKALSWGTQTSVGTYTVVATDGGSGCSQAMSGSAAINPKPNTFSLSGPSQICSGSTENLTLSGSEVGVNYQLLLNGANNGSPIAGTGSALSIAVSNAGSYTVTAQNASTSCAQSMTGTVVLTVNSAPNLNNVSGGGAICSGATTTISLSGSQTGVNYQLQLNGANSGAAIAGTNATLSWIVNAAGTYTVVATNTANCSLQMSGSANVTVNALPTAYNVSGGGAICSGSTTTISLGGSQTGVNYQLQLNGANSGAAIAGTNATLSWTVNAAGTYTVVATNAAGCSLPMTGSASVTFNAMPTAYNVSGGSAICSGSTTAISLSGSQTGVSYQLQLNGANSGAAIAGTNATLSWTVNTAGTYTVVATNTASCSLQMNGSANVTINVLPTTYAVTGGGAICSGTASTVSLGGSEIGVSYQLRLNGVNSGSAIAGTNSTLTWTVNTSGSYTVVATSAAGCSTAMTGSATVVINQVPSNFTVSGGGSVCSGGSSVVTLSGSESGATYQLLLNGSASGGSVSGTGNSISWTVSNTGTYTVESVNTSTSCNQLMTGSASVVVNPNPTKYHLTAGTLCNGGSAVLSLTNSESGINYQLLFNGQTSGSPLSGTGSPLNWTINTAGGYSILATTTAGCSARMLDSLAVSSNPLPKIFSVSGGGTIYTWKPTTPIYLSSSEPGMNYQLRLGNSSIGSILAGNSHQLTWSADSAGTYQVVAINNTTQCSRTMSGNAVVTFSNQTESQAANGVINVKPFQIPAAVKVNRNGVLYSNSIQSQVSWNKLVQGDTSQVFEAPPCIDGTYIAGFQLYYDLGDKQTTVPWVGSLTITLIKGTDSLWSAPLEVNMVNQTFISTEFYKLALSCGEDYRYVVSQKQEIDNLPQDNVYLKLLFYRVDAQPFDPSASLLLNCPYANNETTLGWNFTGNSAIEYDIEWVYIAKYENFLGTTPQEAFQFKEPVRVTTAGTNYKHLIFYDSGTLWYRARAIGYNPQYPDHRIQGQWFYSPCSAITVVNPQPDINWQEQSVFAEEGKYKKVIHYFDGSLRERQVQTNLSTENITLVGESLYDFEGRKEVDILPVPATNASLTYRPNFNVFSPIDGTVTSNVSSTRSKFNYDNRVLENSPLSNLYGAGQYYSPNSQQNGVHKDFIPDGQGYVYSQTEFTNDGTGRVKKKSGVGQTFRTDGDHSTKYFYGGASKTELIRLFGNNVGAAEHYKKNMVVDANGQTSVTYLDQEGRTIATALAGDNPSNVDALDSYKQLNPSPITVDVSSKNTLDNGSWVVTHSMLNAVPNTNYHFIYSLSALASQVQNLGCETCTYSLEITLTDPDGIPVSLSSVPGNQSTDGKSFLRNGITATSCTVPLQVNDIVFDINFAQAGDYTITKRLTPSELTFEQMQQILSQDASVLNQLQAIVQGYPVDASNCEICTTCSDAQQAISEAMEETVDNACDNIYQQIINNLKQAHAEDPDYEPTTTEIQSDTLYCQYKLCIKNRPSDLYDLKMARALTWSVATDSSYDKALNYDPFFNIDTLSGFNSKFAMNIRISNISIGKYNGREYKGTIAQVTDPNNTNYYIDANGNHNATTGKHILYMDLMANRATLGETLYQAKIDTQRWTIFRGFYNDAKQKIKLDIPAYKNCPPALRGVNKQILPTSSSGQAALAAANGVTDSVSTAEVNSSLYSITNSCNASLNKSDSTSIANHLKSYFNSNPNNLYRLIFKEDLSSNTDLTGIQSVLNNYQGCKLDSVAVPNPIVCLKDTTVYLPNEPAFPRPSAQTTFAATQMTMATTMNTFAMASAKTFTNSTDTTRHHRHRFEQRPGQQPHAKAKAPAKKKVEPRKLSSSEKQALLKKREAIKEKLKKKGINPDSTLEQVMQARKHKSLLQRRHRDSLDAVTYIQKQQKTKKKTSKSQTTQLSTMSAMAASTTTDIYTQEYNALWAIYNSTGGDNWYSRYGWSTADPNVVQRPNFAGVNLDGDGHVIALELGFNNLVGTLPPQLGDLVYLRTLHVNGNTLSGSIPAEIGNLTSLYSLYLQQNKLTGSIPSSIGNLVNLYELYAYGNYYYPDQGNRLSGSIPPEIGNCANLTYLYLDTNQLSGEIPSTFGNLANLSHAGLPFNQLSGNLPAEIGNMTHLRELELGYNNLSGNIPATLGSAPNLYWIDLSYNQLSGAIPAEIAKSNLGSLDLSHNQLTGGIPSDFSNCTRVYYYFDLSYNQLSGTVPPTLIQNLFQYWDQLETFRLSHNQFTGQIPAPPHNTYGTIHFYDLSNNQFTGSIPSDYNGYFDTFYFSLANNQLSGTIPPDLFDIGAFYGFDLSHNQLSGEITFSDAAINYYGVYTTALNLSNNQLSGNIPAELGLTNIDVLDLSHNALTGQIPDELKEIHRASWRGGASQLHFSNNQLSGPIPFFLNASSPVCYDTIAFSNNLYTFSDFLPSLHSSASCSATQYFYSPQAVIDSVKILTASAGGSLLLTTAIDTATTAKSLYQWFKYVDGTNDVAISGPPSNLAWSYTIPSVSQSDNGAKYYYKITNPDAPNLTLVSHLQTLNVLSTGGCGATLAQEYHALMDLYAATNGAGWTNNRGWKDADPNVVQSVQGWYGVQVDATGHVTVLDLDGIEDFDEYTGPDGYQVLPGNNLVGTIPTSIGDLRCATFLNLGGNPISGTIPNEIGNLTNLTGLDISFCQLTGSLPPSIWNLTKLTILFLENNKLSGSIPPGASNVTNLWAIALNDNNFSGPIPAEFGNLKSMAYFHLYDNNFTGPIPPELGSMTNLVSLGLYRNQLSGEIPTELGNLKNLYAFFVGRNNLTGSVPSSIATIPRLGHLYLDSCQLSGPIPPEIGNLPLVYMGISNNKFTFSDLLPVRQNLVAHNFQFRQLPGNQLFFLLKQSPNKMGVVNPLPYTPSFDNIAQDSVDVRQDFSVHWDSTFTFTANVDRSTNPPSEYQWYQYGYKVDSLDNSSSSYNIPAASLTDGGYYYYIIRNSDAPELTLISRVQKLTVTDATHPVTFCLKYDTNNPTAQNLSSVPTDLNQWIQQCMQRQAQADSALVSLATAKLYDQLVTDFYNKFQTNCINSTTEQLTYTYVSKEYHYTLYYYDQSANLVQTVPPKGVNPLNAQEIATSLGGPRTYSLSQYWSVNGSTFSSVTDTLGVTREMVVVDTLKTTQGVLLGDTVFNVIPGEKYMFKVRGYATRDSINAIPYLYVASGNQILNWQTAAVPFDAINETWTSVEFAIPQGVTSIKYGVLWKFDTTVYRDTLYIREAQLVHEGNIIDPIHALKTRYQYNSLNQLVSQETPDAGKSNFLYNNKGQLRLSQNAQQYIDGKHSYTRYDDQGRVVEVGEINAQLSMPNVAMNDSINSVHFPMANAYALADVTLTHYDFINTKIQSQFAQHNLRSRVSWVEVTDPTRSDTVRTYYSYDIHGNVNSLLQQVPGLKSKRTDYVYDLVSGKVNYVFYQFDQPDQFCHRYSYDSDNRITLVETSSDRFIWNKEANYSYYLHGPLARTELGEYRVQGLDYYYTLQGWIKGVNTPYAGDPGQDGMNGNMTGKDVFAYNLGYFQNDYVPINGVMTTVDGRDKLWDRALENIQHTGLFNGNISWMETDLAGLPSAKTDRTKGLQGMLYRYDQLHRITTSKSLTSYDAVNGFGVRPTTSAYDENYSYDPNGNITKLKRNDELATLKDNFAYAYYDTTNRLKQHKVSGGLYTYDAIGNLTKDDNEGVNITWTPYGKVRAVHKGDSMTVTYRYDASGNRIEKKVSKNSSVTVTAYLRDASGKVMTIYKDTVSTEVPIYGSARLGEYKGGVLEGDLTLGHRNYELGNHLGNVLSVITDNIGMKQDSVWAKVVSASDYYPFGLSMFGRMWSDTTSNYRYGFNGQESDSETGFLDFQFREYNPLIARFVSVDPIARSYPELTPYQLAGNTPIWAKEYEGLEAWYTSDENGNVKQSEQTGPLTKEYAEKNGLYTKEEIETLRKELDALKAIKNLKTLIENKWRSDDRKAAQEVQERVQAWNDYVKWNNPLYIMYQMTPIPGAIETAGYGMEGNYQMAAFAGILTMLDIKDTKGFSKLLDGELQVGTYRELKALGAKGDNLTPHHIPSANHMESKGISMGDGVTVNIEHNTRGPIGRHAETLTYGNSSDLKMSSRSALAVGVMNLRTIYQAHGLYSKEVHEACYKIIQENKSRFPELFEKTKK